MDLSSYFLLNKQDKFVALNLGATTINYTRFVSAGQFFWQLLLPS
jgi:hypothetical protein